MTHYHGTPIGAGRQDVACFLMGRHALVPFPRPDDMGVVAEVCQSFVLDNGAFTVWKRGGTLDVEAYIEWCYEWHRHPGFDWAVIPDVIEGDESDNDALLSAWPGDIRGVPVWHPHESIGRLVRLCSDWHTVGLGGSPAYPNKKSEAWGNRMAEAMDAICDEDGRPPCRLHGLQLMDPELFQRYPLSSADSVNAGRNCNQLSRFKGYTPPTAAQRAAVIAERIEQHNSPATWQRSGQHHLFSRNGEAA